MTQVKLLPKLTVQMYCCTTSLLCLPVEAERDQDIGLPYYDEEEENQGYGDDVDDNLEGLFDVEAMEKAMATLAAGGQLPPIKQYSQEPEDIESFRKCVGGCSFLWCL